MFSTLFKTVYLVNMTYSNDVFSTNIKVHDLNSLLNTFRTCGKEIYFLNIDLILLKELYRCDVGNKSLHDVLSQENNQQQAGLMNQGYC